LQLESRRRHERRRNRERPLWNTRPTVSIAPGRLRVRRSGRIVFRLTKLLSSIIRSFWRYCGFD
jgi:hypothetical protein